MPSPDATRLLLFTDGPRGVATSPTARVRRFRLARLRLDADRPNAGEPRYAYLKRGHD